MKDTLAMEAPAPTLMNVQPKYTTATVEQLVPTPPAAIPASATLDLVATEINATTSMNALVPSVVPMPSVTTLTEVTSAAATTVTVKTA